MKRILEAVTIGIVIAAVGLLIVLLRSSTPRSENINQEMGYLVSGLVEKDKSVRNCVLAVMKGDGSYSWAGAAGIASQDGQVPMTKDTPIYIASITKLYTATAIMRLVEKRALSLDDPMWGFLPKNLIQGIHVYKGKDFSREVTIKELLSHTSGIADYYTEKPKGGKSLFEEFLEEPTRSWTVDETIERVRRELHANFPPGTDASYSDTNYQLLGKIIEKVTGKPLHTVYEDFFFHPLGLNHTWVVGRSPPLLAPGAAAADIFDNDINITRTRSNGAYWADGGIVSTAEEMILFLKALNEGHIIRQDTLKSMHAWHKLHFPIQYGYGTMYFSLPGFISRLLKVTPLWGHSGSTGSFLYYSEELNLYMAGTIDQTESTSKPFRLMMSVMKAFHSEGEPRKARIAKQELLLTNQ